MKKHLLYFIVLLSFNSRFFSQDTFSILAFDSVTREVGAAGASCLDLFNTSWLADDFITEVFPDTGAIATQAAFNLSNQSNARLRMRAGETPTQVLTWLKASDINGTPEVRQYGVIRIGASPQTAAFTGSNCMTYKNHIVGPNYTIHGNILLGQQVLDSMEARFKRAEGDLACKLMAAMQGANMIGADSRCASNNSSSLFAFLKVSQPTDTFGKPSFIISLRTHSGAKIEPIDSLQKKFDAARTCTVNTLGLSSNQPKGGFFMMHPNPALEEVTLSTGINETTKVLVTDLCGRKVAEFTFTKQTRINLKDYNKGVYFVELQSTQLRKVKKLVVN